MNVTLPEKNKINKRRIMIYSIAIFACILAIVVVIGIQILGNDVVDNFFGVSKITKKTEEEENRLKANFDTLFQNQLENNSSCEVKKIDKNKDIVYTNYENTDKSANNYEMNVNLPYINIKNQSVQDYNENIKNIFQAKAEEVLKSTNSNVIYTVKYEAYIENNILSLIIYSDLKQDSSAQRIIVQTFNFNLETNKELTLEDIIKIYELDEKTVQDKIDNEIKTNKNYAIVEKTIKEYLTNIKNTYLEIEQLNLALDADEIFSASNVEDKKFKNIDKLVEEDKQKGKENLEKCKDMIKEENIIEAINAQKFSSNKEYYIEIYKTIMLSDSMKNQYEKIEQKVERSKDKLYDNLTIISNTKKYLESNSKYWSTKDGKLFFQDINIMTGYYNLRNELDI